jgi:hypothetical protein
VSLAGTGVSASKFSDRFVSADTFTLHWRALATVPRLSLAEIVAIVSAADSAFIFVGTSALIFVVERPQASTTLGAESSVEIVLDFGAACVGADEPDPCFVFVLVVVLDTARFLDSDEVTGKRSDRLFARTQPAIASDFVQFG